MPSDRYDTALEDCQLREEISLLAELIIVANASAGALGQPVVDEALGLA